MQVTVCICTRDRPHYLRDCLNGLRHQTLPPEAFDILVVDNASTGDVPAQLARLVAECPNGHLLRVEPAGISIARNEGARAAAGDYIAYLDDDAIPEPDWIERIVAAIGEGDPPPALIGGRILPRWEAPLPDWWPARLVGVLSIIEAEVSGEFRTPAVPAGLEPYGANMVVNAAMLRDAGGFGLKCGRFGRALLSDEDVQLAWRLQDAGHSVRYDARIVVRHQIQAMRLTPRWLMSRLYWQGVSTVLTRRVLGSRRDVWRDVPRRLVVALLLLPIGLLPKASTRLIACRWRLAYSLGFLRGAFGPQPGM